MYIVHNIVHCTNRRRPELGSVNSQVVGPRKDLAIRTVHTLSRNGDLKFPMKKIIELFN